MYVRMHLSYFVPIVTFHLPWGACCTGWNDEESRNGGKSAQADDRDDKGHQTLVGVVCKRQGDEMQQKWVEKHSGETAIFAGVSCQRASRCLMSWGGKGVVLGYVSLGE